FPMVSSVHARIEESGDGRYSIIHLSRSNPTLRNDEVVRQSAPIEVGDVVRLGYTGPVIEILGLSSHAADDSGESAGFNQTIEADARHLALLRGSSESRQFDLGNGGVIGRERDEVSFLLNHPHVSRQHARIVVSDNRIVIKDLGSANGTFVNGERISHTVELDSGDRIDIGPFSLRLEGATLISRSRSNNIELSARRISRAVIQRGSGQPLILVADVDLVVRPREFVCLLGPSGSGKSTLMNILSGRNAPNRGIVGLNGENLYENFEAFKEDLAVVPQRDILPTALSVRDALRYTAALRLPADSDPDEIDDAVSDILEVVGLTERSETLIKNLSGGQLKRVSLANELVARPSVLFLDEVTSGLDEQTDGEIMQLFRQVADGGKTVVCITHNLAHVESACHLVVILTEGGKTAFIGKPREACDYFGISRLGDVYLKLSEKNPDAWLAQFRASP
ncbi:MAG: FHA domain-containing protein, partial [Planctomycetaceae bacterium]|nr:FHA domain-containing protein [Planctomycetaceae bacterium]